MQLSVQRQSNLDLHIKYSDYESLKHYHLVKNRILADKDKKDEATPEKVDTSDDSEDKLSR